MPSWFQRTVGTYTYLFMYMILYYTKHIVYRWRQRWQVQKYCDKIKMAFFKNLLSLSCCSVTKTKSRAITCVYARMCTTENKT